MNLLLPLLACIIQDPQPVEISGRAPIAPVSRPSLGQVASNSGGRLDVVKLKNGDDLIGRVTADLDGYVEIEIEDGATIGVSRAQVKEILMKSVAVSVRATVVRPETAWFVLHDADGASVGWLHSSVTTSNDGTFTVNEEYEFVNGKRRYQITNQCTADKNGRGLRCYYRERVSHPKLLSQMPGVDQMGSGDRIEDERIVDAVIDSEQLVIRRLDGRGRSERQLPWRADSTFPLLARTLARQAKSVVGPVAMFDPQGEQLIIRRVDGTGVRTMTVAGLPQRVGEVAETDAAGDNRVNREWVDVNLQVVRRELAGPALVAVPSSAESARGAVGVSSIESAIVAEANGRFGLWVPNPSWTTIDPLPPGHLMLRCAAHQAELRLALIDHLASGTVLETATDAVANWFLLLYPQLQVDSRYNVRIRGRRAMRISATDSRNVDRATIDVIPFEDHYLVLICHAPKRAWDELLPDFEFIRRTVELDAAGLNPSLQGPLRLGRDGRSRQPSGPVPAPTPAPRIVKSEGSGRVRIPE